MPKLPQLSTSTIYLVPTILSFHPCVQFRLVLKNSLHHDINRSFSNRNGDKKPNEDVSPIISNDRFSKENTSSGRVSRLISSIRSSFSLLDKYDTKNPTAEKSFSEGKKTSIMQDGNVSGEHDNKYTKLASSDQQSVSFKVTIKPKVAQKYTPEVKDEESRKKIPLIRWKRFLSPNVVRTFPYEPNFRKVYQPFRDEVAVFARSDHDEGGTVPNKKLSETHKSLIITSEPKAEIPKTSNGNKKSATRKISKDYEVPLTTNLNIGRNVENSQAVDQVLAEEPRKPTLSRSKISERKPSTVSGGQKKSQKPDSSNQNLPEKRSSRKIQIRNQSQTERVKPPSVETVTQPCVEEREVAEKKVKLDSAKLPCKNEGSLVENQILSESSGNSKLKSDEKHNEEKSPLSSHAKLLLHNNNKPCAGPKLTLLEELFPEEIGKSADPYSEDSSEESVPRLPLPEFDDEDELNEDALWRLSKEDRMATGDSEHALHEWNVAVLVISRASKSLNESDFRRIIPRGRHIDEWRGPGDFLKG